MCRPPATEAETAIGRPQGIAAVHLGKMTFHAYVLEVIPYERQS